MRKPSPRPSRYWRSRSGSRSPGGTREPGQPPSPRYPAGAAIPAHHIPRDPRRHRAARARVRLLPVAGQQAGQRERRGGSAERHERVAAGRHRREAEVRRPASQGAGEAAAPRGRLRRRDVVLGTADGLLPGDPARRLRRHPRPAGIGAHGVGRRPGQTVRPQVWSERSPGAARPRPSIPSRYSSRDSSRSRAGSTRGSPPSARTRSSAPSISR